MLNLRGKYAVCVGGTSGIGRAVAVKLAELQANVTVVGRNPQLGAEILNDLNKANPTGDHSFVSIDASSMKSISHGCDSFLKATKDKPLHYLVMSQGMASMNGRTETTEGIDQKLALHYYGRVMFVRKLSDKLKQTALQPENHDVRVLSILSGGVHSAYTDTTDLDLKRNFTLSNAANAAGFYNDLAVDALARDTAYLSEADKIAAAAAADAKRGISYIHAAPGFVKTTWGKDFPFYLTIPLRVAQLFAKSPEECATLMVEHGLLSQQRQGQGYHIMGEKGEVKGVTKEHTDEMREKVWAHTNDLLDRALAMN